MYRLVSGSSRFTAGLLWDLTYFQFVSPCGSVVCSIYLSLLSKLYGLTFEVFDLLLQF